MSRLSSNSELPETLTFMVEYQNAFKKKKRKEEHFNFKLVGAI